MVPPTNLSMWLNDQAWPLGILLVVALSIYVVLRFSSRKRVQALIRERDGVTAENFAEFLAQYNFDPLLSGATYRYLQQVQRVGFPILPTDNLDEDLGLGYDDIEQSVNDLSSALGLDLTHIQQQGQIVTVEDLIRQLQSAPRSNKQGIHAA